ncbi:MAG TPA: hypothetical protein VFZ16_11540 [Hyphomicrobiaceae bacterium]|nr:hypothetical protein [Hyphomicrobiaceae bacterium]
MSANGTWRLVLQTPIGERTAEVTLAATDDMLTGRMTSDEGNTTDIYAGTLAGNRLSWKADIKNPMPLTLELTGTINGDSMTGTVSTPLGSWPFSGHRGA